MKVEYGEWQQISECVCNDWNTEEREVFPLDTYAHVLRQRPFLESRFDKRRVFTIDDVGYVEYIRRR